MLLHSAAFVTVIFWVMEMLLIFSSMLCVTSGSDSFTPLAEGKESHHSAQQFLSDPATWRHKLELTPSHANTEQTATSSGLSASLELSVSLGSLYWRAQTTLPLLIPKPWVCLFIAASQVINCVIWLCTAAYSLPVSLEEQNGSTGMLQLFPKEQPLGQPCLIPRHNHNSKCVIHVESKANSTWLILHEELAQGIRPSPAVLTLNKKNNQIAEISFPNIDWVSGKVLNYSSAWEVSTYPGAS